LTKAYINVENKSTSIKLVKLSISKAMTWAKRACNVSPTLAIAVEVTGVVVSLVKLALVLVVSNILETVLIIDVVVVAAS